MDLNHRDIVYYLISLLQYNRKLRDFNMSNCQIQGNFFAEILEALAGEYEGGPGDPQLQSLNVSYNSLSTLPALRAAEIAGHLSTILGKSVSLTHVDLSGMGLGENIKPIIEAVTESEH